MTFRIGNILIIWNGILFNDDLLKTYFENGELYKQQIRCYENYIKDKEFAELLFD